MALITNTAGGSNIESILPLVYGQVLFTTPANLPGENNIFIAYITETPSENVVAIVRPQLKYILGPATTFKWDNNDPSETLRVHWTWAQMEIS